jgi:hypothetical protein
MPALRHTTPTGTPSSTSRIAPMHHLERDP